MSSIQTEEESGASFREVLLGMILILPFLLRSCGVFRVTGYRSLRNGQTVVALLAPFQREVSQLFLLIQLSLINAKTLEAGLIFLKSLHLLDHLFWNAARSEFLSNLNYKMRTLLKGSLDKSRTLKPDRTLIYCQTNGLGTLYQSGWRSLVLISNILDLAKICVHRLKIPLTDSYWRTVLNGIVVITQVQAIERSLCLQLKYFPNLATRICAAEKILCEVLSNLFGKVVRFTEQSQVTLCVCPGCICLGVPVERLPIENSKLMLVQHLCFEVSDTSMGMMQRQLEKILQSLKQFRNIQPQSAETGVELAIDQHWVELTVGNLKTISRWSKELRFWSEGSLRKVVAPLAPFVYCPNQPFCASSAEKMEGLCKLIILTLLGNVQNIQDRANYSEQQNDRYPPFTSKVEDSVQKLPERAIATLVESYLYLGRSL